MRGGVGDDAGDVGGRRERADLQRPLGVLLELVAQVVAVDAAVGVLPDHHDVGDRLPPRDLVGVVLVGAEEHHRPLRRRDVLGQRVLVVEHRRHPQPEHADQLGDRTGAARPGEDHHAVVAATDRLPDDLAGLLAQPRRLQPGAAGLGVGVGVARQHLVADEVLDEGERAPGRRVVGVRHPAAPVRRLHHVVVADHGVADQPQQRLCVSRTWSHATTIGLGPRLRSCDLHPPGVSSSRKRIERRALLSVESYDVRLDLASDTATFGSVTTLRFTSAGRPDVRRPEADVGPQHRAQREPDRRRPAGPRAAADRHRGRHERAGRRRGDALPQRRRGTAPQRRPRRRPALRLRHVASWTRRRRSSRASTSPT